MLTVQWHGPRVASFCLVTWLITRFRDPVSNESSNSVVHTLCSHTTGAGGWVLLAASSRRGEVHLTSHHLRTILATPFSIQPAHGRKHFSRVSDSRRQIGGGMLLVLLVPPNIGTAARQFLV